MLTSYGRSLVWLYNTERPHSALAGRTPAEAYRGEAPVDMMDTPMRGFPTSPQVQQQQQEDRFKGTLAAWASSGIHLKPAARLSE